MLSSPDLICALMFLLLDNHWCHFSWGNRRLVHRCAKFRLTSARCGLVLPWCRKTPTAVWDGVTTLNLASEDDRETKLFGGGWGYLLWWQECPSQQRSRTSCGQSWCSSLQSASGRCGAAPQTSMQRCSCRNNAGGWQSQCTQTAEKKGQGN